MDSQTLDDLEDLQIDVELEDIQIMSKEKYMKIVKEAVEKKAFFVFIRKEGK